MRPLVDFHLSKAGGGQKRTEAEGRQGRKSEGAVDGKHGEVEPGARTGASGAHNRDGCLREAEEPAGRQEAGYGVERDRG